MHSSSEQKKREKSTEKPVYIVNQRFDKEYKEDSLDRRLKEAKESAAKLDMMFKEKNQ